MSRTEALMPRMKSVWELLSDPSRLCFTDCEKTETPLAVILNQFFYTSVASDPASLAVFGCPGLPFQRWGNNGTSLDCIFAEVRCSCLLIGYDF